MQDNNKFDFTYSAPTERERREIESIRRQYVTREITEEAGASARIKELHARVVGVSTSVSLAFGVIGILIFGFGMALTLEWANYLFGVICGVIGSALMLLAYPVHLGVLNIMKKKYSEEIVRLSDKLLGDKGEPRV